MIRRLEEKDLTSLVILVNSRDNFLGIPQDRLDIQRQFSIANMKLLLEKDNSLGAIFAYEDETGELKAAVVTLVSSVHPCYYINKAYTRPDASLFMVGEVVNEVVKFYEALGYKRFYTMFKKDLVKKYRRLGKALISINGYLSYTEMEIDSQERPKYSDFWELLFGRQLYIDPMVIRGYVKLDETSILNF